MVGDCAAVSVVDMLTVIVVVVIVVLSWLLLQPSLLLLLVTLVLVLFVVVAVDVAQPVCWVVIVSVVGGVSVQPDGQWQNQDPTWPKLFLAARLHISPIDLQEQVAKGDGSFGHWREPMERGFEHTASRLRFSTPGNVPLQLGFDLAI